MNAPNTDRPKLGELMVRERELTPEELEDALRGQGATMQPLGSSILKQGLATEQKVCRALSEQLGVPAVQLTASTIETSVLGIIPENVAIGHRVLPLSIEGEVVRLAMSTPEDQSLLDEIAFACGKKALPFVAPRGVLDEVLRAAYAARLQQLPVWQGPNSTHTEPHLEKIVAKPPPTEPVVPTAEPAELNALETFPELPPPLERPADGKKRVLAVDDEVEILDIIDMALSSRGIEVIRATRGREALEKLRAHQPDMVLLDAMLPEIHGFEICSQIKGSEHYKDTPVIIISAIYTGWNFIQDVKRIHGADGYIEKPFRVMEVVRRVEETLAELEGRGASETEASHHRAAKALAAASEALKQGDIEEGLSAAHHAVGADPFDPRAHFVFATALQRAGKLYEAISEYERVVELAPGQFSALKNLAVLYERQGFKSKAVEMWTRALDQSPSDAVRQTIKAHLIGLL